MSLQELRLLINTQFTVADYGKYIKSDIELRGKNWLKISLITYKTDGVGAIEADINIVGRAAIRG